MLKAILGNRKHTHADLLSIKVWSDQKAMSWSIAQGRMLFQLLNAALQNMLKALVYTGCV